MKSQKKLGIGLWIPIIIILITIIISVCIYFAKTEEYKNWKSTAGVILEIKKTNGSGRGRKRSSSSHRIYFSYVLNDKKYTANTSYRGTKTNFKAGDSVQVWYNPDNQAKASFSKPSPAFAPFTPFFIGFPFAILFFRRNKNKKRNPNTLIMSPEM